MFDGWNELSSGENFLAAARKSCVRCKFPSTQKGLRDPLCFHVNNENFLREWFAAMRDRATMQTSRKE